MDCVHRKTGQASRLALACVLCTSAALVQLMPHSHATAQDIHYSMAANSEDYAASGAQPTTVIINGQVKPVLSFKSPALSWVGQPAVNAIPVSPTLDCEPSATARRFQDSVVSLAGPVRSIVVELDAPTPDTSSVILLQDLAPPADPTSLGARVVNLPAPVQATLPIEGWSPPSALVARAYDTLASYRQDSVSKHDLGMERPTPRAQFEQTKLPMLRYPEHCELTLIDAIHCAIHFSPAAATLRANVATSHVEFGRQAANHVGNRFHGSLPKLAQDLGIPDSNSQFFESQNQARFHVSLVYQPPILAEADLQVNTSLVNTEIANFSAVEEEFSASLQAHVLQVVTTYRDLVTRRGECAKQKREYERTTNTGASGVDRVPLDVGWSAGAETTAAVTRTQALRAEYAVVLAQEQLLRLVFGQSFQQSVDHEVIPTSEMFGPAREVQLYIEVPMSQ